MYVDLSCRHIGVFIVDIARKKAAYSLTLLNTHCWLEDVRQFCSESVSDLATNVCKFMCRCVLFLVMIACAHSCIVVCAVHSTT